MDLSIKTKSNALKMMTIFMVTASVTLGIGAPVSYAATVDQTGVVTTSGANLNVRSGAGTSYEVVTKLSKGTTVEVEDETNNDWYKVTYDSGKTGYVSGDYLKVTPDFPLAAKVTTGSVKLNLREKPTTSSKILAKIPRGSNITLTKIHDSVWYEVSYNGMTGYVHSDYISLNKNNTSSTSKPAANTSKYKYTKKLLNVVSYSQTDSRWANTRLGNSKYTIKQCGCTVCGLAQIETYRTGKTVTPANMAKRLTFNSEGSLYWPAGYKQYYGSDYLQKIYEQIQDGNPVLVGGYTTTGRQHWIVVTGYKANSNTLKTSDFVINDCAGRHDTLAEYFSMFSKFKKIVYKN